MRATILGLLAGLVGGMAGVANAAEPVSFKILKLEGNTVRWQKAGEGQTQIVTYSLVTGDVAFSGARNCRKMTALDGLTAKSAVETAHVRSEIAAAFAMWQEVANISFREASHPARADILIGAQLEPEGWAFADVFYDAQSPLAVKPISRSLICLNPDKRWKIGFNGDLKTYDLRYTIAHEIGHAIGLDHPTNAGSIMGYRYEERFRRLQPGDIQGALILYGSRMPDETITAARQPHDAPENKAPDDQSGSGTRALNSRSN